jgi:hypothetical protein
MKTFLCLIFQFLVLPTYLKAQTEILTDIDGNTYHTIKIREQVWMVENLKTTKFNDGTLIPLVSDSEVWGKISHPAYCWYNNDEKTNKNNYGALYNWFAVETGKLCPIGWHVPSDKVWLEKAILPGGNRDENGAYWYLNYISYYWTSTECSTTEAYDQGVSYLGNQVTRGYTFKKYGHSVRCIKNNN